MTEIEDPIQGCKHDFFEIGGEHVCKKCGLVDSEKVLDHYPVKNRGVFEGFVSQNERHQAWDVGNRTEFEYWKLEGKKRGKFYRLNRINNAEFSSVERSLKKSKFLIYMFCTKYGLPQNVQERAKMLFLKLKKQKKLYGSRMKDIILILLHIICRQQNIEHKFISDDGEEYLSPLCSKKDIHEIEEVPKKHLNHMLIKVCNIFNIRNLGRVDFRQRLNEFLKKLEKRRMLSDKAHKNLLKHSEYIQELCKNQPFSTRDTSIVIAVFIYVFQDELGFEVLVTQRELTEMIGNITEVTLRKYIKILKGVRNDEKKNLPVDKEDYQKLRNWFEILKNSLENNNISP